MSESCFICGESREHVLDSHHIVPDRYGGSDEQFNRVTLCATCHRSVEEIYDESFYSRLGLDKEDVKNQSASAANQIWEKLSSPKDVSKGDLILAKSDGEKRLFLRCRSVSVHKRGDTTYEFYRVFCDRRNKNWSMKKVENLLNDDTIRIYTGSKPPSELVSDELEKSVTVVEKYDPW